MPRATRSHDTMTGTNLPGASLPPHKGHNNNKNKKGLNQDNKNHLKAANKNNLKSKQISLRNENNFDKTKLEAKTKTAKGRAALGEITNAFSETKSQAKKGLSKMLSKSKSTLTRQSSTRTKSTTSNNKNSSNSKFHVSSEETPDVQQVEDPSEDSRLTGQTSRLPSSQEQQQEEDDVDKMEVDIEEEVNENSSRNNKSGESEDQFESAEGGEDEETNKLVKTRQIPSNVIDFDAKHADDHFQVSEYVNETFQYYKNREAQFRVPNYLPSFQPDITPSMRAILIDWLVEVQESFELNHETLYTAVKLIDLYLSRVKSRKEDLQLIGATACLIACKIDERLPPLLDDFVYVCDDAYTKEDIKAMEMKMIRTVDYDTGYPLSYRYLRRYGRVCQITMPVLTFGRFVLEMALMEYGLNVEVSESKLAVAALMLTFLVTKTGEPNWKETLEFYSGYKLDECKSLAHKLHRMLLKPAHETRKTIRNKYEHEVFHRVAKIPIPAEIEL